MNARWLVGPKGAGGAPELTWEMGDGRWEMGVFLRGWEAGHLRHGWHGFFEGLGAWKDAATGRLSQHGRWGRILNFGR